jgi:hypothetical protein
MMKKWVFVLPLVALVPLGLTADGALVSVGTGRRVADFVVDNFLTRREAEGERGRRRPSPMATIRK